MGWFDSFRDFVSDTVGGIKDAVVSVYEKGKEFAGKALGVMAVVGEKIVQTAKYIWQKAKPVLQKIQVAAKVVKKIPGLNQIPWVIAAAEFIDRGLTALFALEKSPVLKKIAAGLDWAIKTARHLSEKLLNEKEMAEAEERKRQFTQAVDSLNDEQRRAVLFGQIVNELLMVRTKLEKLISQPEMVDFDHYLRLRATQKLLVKVNQRLNSVNEIEYITIDDLFLLEVAQELLTLEPNLTDIQLQRLNRLVIDHYGKELVPFVFEELLKGWALALNHDEALVKKLQNELSSDEAIFKRLQSNLKFEIPLTVEETVQLEALRISLPMQRVTIENLYGSIRHRTHFIDAAEGLLQALENKIAEKEMRLIPDVGKIIINCMEKGVEWAHLSEEDRGLVIDFANIFRENRIERGKELIEESEAMILVEVTA